MLDTQTETQSWLNEGGAGNPPAGSGDGAMDQMTTDTGTQGNGQAMNQWADQQQQSDQQQSAGPTPNPTDGPDQSNANTDVMMAATGAGTLNVPDITIESNGGRARAYNQGFQDGSKPGALCPAHTPFDGDSDLSEAYSQGWNDGYAAQSKARDEKSKAQNEPPPDPNWSPPPEARNTTPEEVEERKREAEEREREEEARKEREEFLKELSREAPE